MDSMETMNDMTDEFFDQAWAEFKDVFREPLTDIFDYLTQKMAEVKVKGLIKNLSEY